MNKMIFSKNIVLIALIGVLSSCGKDFLDQPPRAALTVGTFPTSADDALLATNAVYNILRSWQINTGGFPLLDMMADDAVKGSNPGDGTAVAVYDNFQNTATEGSSERWYKTLYEAVRRANLVINDVPGIEMDEALKTRYLAEARFLRAYFYADLVRGYGDVPKVMEIDPPLDLVRTSVTEILSDIIYPDLAFAVNNLPERSEYAKEDLGRITKGAARSFLARIKMFYGNFSEAEVLLKEVVNSNQYQLLNNFGDVFLYTNEQNLESIFEISAIPNNFTNGGNQYANTQGVRGIPNKGWGFGRPAYSWIKGVVSKNDPRLEPSIIFLNEVLDGISIGGDSSTPDTTYQNGQIVEIECYNQKVWVGGNESESSFGHNRKIIRYADVLLMYAECLNENGKSPEALTFLNQIRKRARGANSGVLPDVTTTDKNALRDAILEERKVELAFEGLRFWDLVRTKRAEAVLGPLGFIVGKNELFPIPQSEVDISQGRITQNPGY